MIDTMEIDFSEITQDKVRNISGHERGVAARRKFMLDELDERNDRIDILIPQGIEAIATSFFQGMFSKSVQRFGSKESFLSHYRFVAAPSIMEQILRGIDRSLTPRRGAVGT